MIFALNFAAAVVATTAALFSPLSSAQPAPAPEVLRGPLPPELANQLRLTAPVQVATCPAGFNERFANQKLACERRIVQFSDVKCPGTFPNFTARNVTVGTDRDLCAKAGVNISSDGALTNFRNGIDYVFVPSNGVRNGVSFVARDPDATPADGWLINASNGGSSGITDRYQRTLVLRKTPILVNP